MSRGIGLKYDYFKFFRLFCFLFECWKTFQLSYYYLQLIIFVNYLFY